MLCSMFFPHAHGICKIACNKVISNTKTNSFIINDGEKGDICYAVCGMIIQQTGIVQCSLSIGKGS